MILKQRGIPPSNIITFMYDDVAHSWENPYKGKLFNSKNGPDVYPGQQNIDYRGKDVTPENFLKVLLGQKMQVGSGKTLMSGPNDRIFVYFAVSSIVS